MRFGAIDIGSNAVRCLIAEVTAEEPAPVKLKLLRIPIRLGFDTFLDGRISDQRRTNLLRTLRMFRLLMDIYDVQYHRACATSAMRDATNGAEIAADILQETGIQIEVIDGREEAQIIFAARAYEHLDPNKSYLFIDVGGGSTDVTLFAKGREQQSQTFNIGTIRLLNQQVQQSDWQVVKEWLDTHLTDRIHPIAVGSGGNINTVFQLSRKKKGSALTCDYLLKFQEQVMAMSVEERIKQLALKPDRADVIGHAVTIYTNFMKWGNIRRMLVPQVGLVDGIVQQLAQSYYYGSSAEPSYH